MRWASSRFFVYSVCTGMSLPHIASEALVDGLVVIPEGAGMNLHDEPVLHRHAVHFHQHVGHEGARILVGGLSLERLLKKLFGPLI